MQTHTHRGGEAESQHQLLLQWVTLLCKSADEQALAAITGCSSNVVSIELLTCGSFSPPDYNQKAVWLKYNSIPARCCPLVYFMAQSSSPHIILHQNAQCDAEFLDLCLVLKSDLRAHPTPRLMGWRDEELSSPDIAQIKCAIYIYKLQWPAES